MGRGQKKLQLRYLSEHRMTVRGRAWKRPLAEAALGKDTAEK